MEGDITIVHVSLYVRPCVPPSEVICHLSFVICISGVVPSCVSHGGLEDQGGRLLPVDSSGPGSGVGLGVDDTQDGSSDGTVILPSVTESDADHCRLPNHYLLLACMYV